MRNTNHTSEVEMLKLLEKKPSFVLLSNNKAVKCASIIKKVD